MICSSLHTLHGIVKALALVMCLWIGAFHDVFSQKSSDQFPEEYDELFVYLSVENLGYYEIDAIYASEKLYMPCLKLFKILSIYTEASAQLDSISGYMADRSKSFQLNFTTNKLIYAGKQLDVTAADYLISYDDVFLSADVYKNLFGFSLNLDFRSLLVRLQSDSELPIVKILKQKKLRENLRSLSGEIQIDSTVQREFHVYRGAVLDWNIRLSQSSTEKPTAQLRGALGMELLGGEFVVRSAISSQNKNGIRSQSFRWRYISNKSALLRQVNVGFIGVPLNSQVTVPLFGAGVSNTPVGFRSSYGSITLRRNTQPGWEVEVFVNNVLVGYATADANGDVQLEIPLMYGNTEIQIRYYGPWGEEEIEEQSIAIPFLFVPQGKLEYQAFYGVTADSVRNNFSYARLAYGLNRRVTLFAGHEYFDRNTVNRTMPFASASLVLSDGLLMNYQFVSNAYHTTSMLWRLPSGFFFEGRGKWYNQNQDAELNNNLTEYTGSFNFPFSIGKSRWLTRGQLRQIQLPSSSNSFVEAAASTFYKRLNAGLTFGGNLSNSNQTYTSVNASYQLPKQWLLQTGAQYASSTQQLSNIRVLVQKRFKRSVVANFNITGIENMKSASIGLNVFFDLGWMGVSTEAIRSDQSWKSNQNFGGSTLFGKAPNAIQTNTRSTMGRGAVDAALYLDVNHNNSKDADEPLVKGVAIKMSRGVEAKRDNDSIYRFVALEPYTRHLLNVSESGLQEISWRLPFKTIGVYADPNSVKQVFIPVLPMGELEGRVMKLNDNNEAKGMARIPIVISDAKGNFIARVSSDADGYFNYAELKPGTYRVYVDAEALARAGFTPSDPREVVVKPLANGDYIQDVDFQIKSNGN